MFNQKSTPKKIQNCSDEIDKRVSIDIIYSELQDVKNNINKSYDCSYKLDQIERDCRIKQETINILTEKVSKIEEQHERSESRMNQEYSKLKQEFDLHKNVFRGMKTEYTALVDKVNDLCIEIQSIKHSNTQNNMEDIIKRHITSSYENIKFAMGEHMNKINFIFSQSISLDDIPANSKTAGLIKPASVFDETSITAEVPKTKENISNIPQKPATLFTASVSNPQEPGLSNNIPQKPITLFSTSVLNKDTAISFGGNKIDNSPVFGGDNKSASLSFGISKSSEDPQEPALSSNIPQKPTPLFSTSVLNKDTAISFGGNKIDNSPVFGGDNKSASLSFGISKSSEDPQESALSFNIPQKPTPLFSTSVLNKDTAISFGGNKMDNSSVFGGDNKSASLSFGISKSSEDPQEPALSSNIPQKPTPLFSTSVLNKDTAISFGGNKIDNSPVFGGDNKSASLSFGISKSSEDPQESALSFNIPQKPTPLFSTSVLNKDTAISFGGNKMDNSSVFGGDNKSASLSFGISKSSEDQSLFNPKSQTNIFNNNANKTEPLFGIKSQPTNLFAQPASNNSGLNFGSKTGNIFGDSTKTNQSVSVSKTSNIFGDSGKTNLFGSTTQPIKLLDTNNSKETSSSLIGFNDKSNVDESNKPFNFPTAPGSDLPSFSSLSKTASDSTGFGTQAEAKWQSGSKLFTSKPNPSESLEENSEQNLEEEHDPHFQPIIDLPPLVSVQKDEELHDVLFRSRCKLYRFINNEWKERGVGEMKILQTKESVDQSKPVKLVMRRDQVRKICCNQRVSKNVPAFTEMPNVKSTCWVGNDFSEGEPAQEKFAIRFAHVDELNKFKGIVEKIQSEMSSVEKTD